MHTLHGEWNLDGLKLPQENKIGSVFVWNVKSNQSVWKAPVLGTTMSEMPKIVTVMSTFLPTRIQRALAFSGQVSFQNFSRRELAPHWRSPPAAPGGRASGT
jgi:hypothetical protein